MEAVRYAPSSDVRSWERAYASRDMQHLVLTTGSRKLRRSDGHPHERPLWAAFFRCACIRCPDRKSGLGSSRACLNATLAASPRNKQDACCMQGRSRASLPAAVRGLRADRMYSDTARRQDQDSAQLSDCTGTPFRQLSQSDTIASTTGAPTRVMLATVSEKPPAVSPGAGSRCCCVVSSGLP